MKTDEKKLTPQEREQALQDFQARQAEIICKGKRIVWVIALANAGLQALQFVMPNDGFNWAALALGAVLSVVLLAGGWGLRYVLGAYAAVVAWQVFRIMYYANSTRRAYGADEVIALALIHIVWLVLLAWYLLFNEAAAAYLYMKRNR